MHRPNNRRTDPVVWEVPVDDLAHDCRLVVEQVGAEVEDYVEHGGLGGEGGAALFGEGVGRHLVVEVVGAQAPHHHAHKRTVDPHSTAAAAPQYYIN